MRNRVTSKAARAVIASVVLGLLALPIAFAGAEGDAQAKGSKGTSKQVKKLKRQMSALQRQVAELSKQLGPEGARGPEGPQGPAGPEGPPGPSTGPAGGDLTGTFPNPQIGVSRVGSPEIAERAVGTSELANDSVDNIALATNSVGPDEIGGDVVGREEIALNAVTSAELALGSVGANEMALAIPVVGTGVTVTTSTGAQTAVVRCPASHPYLLTGGYGWSKNEPNSIIASAPNETAPSNAWAVTGMVNSGSNTLFAWANCLPVQ